MKPRRENCSSFVWMIAILVTATASLQRAHAECKPLVVTFGGAWDEKTEIMKSLAEDLGRFTEVEYYHDYEENLSRGYIKNHLREYPDSPIGLNRFAVRRR